MRFAPLLCIALASGCATTMATTTNAGAPTRTALFAQYDRITGDTKVSSWVFSRTPMVGPSVQLWVYASHRDSILTAPLPSVLVVFKATTGTQSEGWRFLRDHDLALLLDDTTRLSYSGVRDSDLGSVLLHEDIGFRIPTDDFLRIASASKVEGRLGTWSFATKPEEQMKIREFAEFARQAPDAPRPYTAGRASP